MPEILPLHPRPCVWIDYTNWKGERAVRCIRPYELFWGTSQYHPTPQYLLKAWDVDKGAERTFAFCDIGKVSATPFTLDSD